MGVKLLGNPRLPGNWVANKGPAASMSLASSMAGLVKLRDPLYSFDLPERRIKLPSANFLAM